MTQDTVLLHPRQYHSDRRKVSKTGHESGTGQYTCTCKVSLTRTAEGRYRWRAVTARASVVTSHDFRLWDNDEDDKL